MSHFPIRRPAGGLAALSAAVLLIAGPLAAQLQLPGNVRPRGTLMLAPSASVQVQGTVYALTEVPATIYLSNVRNVKSHVRILNTRVAGCALDPDAMMPHEVVPVGGRASFSVPLYFINPEASGRECPLNVALATPDDPTYREIPGAVVSLARSQTYTIEDTWAVVPFVSSIVATRINAPDAPCTGLSLGLSGVIPIGAVEYERDLSFTLRSGIHPPECTFDSGDPKKRLAKGWAIVGRSWRTERARGSSDACSINNYQSDQPSGTYFYVHSQMRCGGGPDNDNGIRLILQRLTLIGPPGHGAIDAFTSN